MPGDPTNRILIVDGHAYAYRAFFAIRQLASPEGKPTNAIYGFIKMLARMRTVLQPTGVVVIWDGGLARERVEALPGYKAQRPSMPEDMSPQLDEIGEYLSAAGIASLCHDGVEADDWIAVLARTAVDAGHDVVIASSDKDFMQLVTPAVGLLNPNDKSETVWGMEQVRAKSGVEPSQIVDWLSLIGDAVDNIPGVPGVGPKTATDLLNQFGSIDAIYQALATVKSDRLRANLTAAEADVRRNQQLIRLRMDLPVAAPANCWTMQPENSARLAALYRKWGFRTLLREIEAAQPEQKDFFEMAGALAPGNA